MKQLKMIKGCLENAVAAQVTDLSNVNAQELGEVVDMIKDLSEAIYYCKKIDYMEEEQEMLEKLAKEKQQQGGETYQRDMDRQQQRMYYTEPGMVHGYNPWNRQESHYEDRMYYDGGTSRGGGGSTNNGSNSNSSNGGSRNYTESMMRDDREGRSGSQRRTYMESKQGHHDKAITMQKLELYAQDLVTDVLEMLQDATPEEKSLLHKKLVALSEKVKTL